MGGCQPVQGDRDAPWGLTYRATGSCSRHAPGIRHAPRESEISFSLPVNFFGWPRYMDDDIYAPQAETKHTSDSSGGAWACSRPRSAAECNRLPRTIAAYCARSLSRIFHVSRRLEDHTAGATPRNSASKRRIWLSLTLIRSQVKGGGVRRERSVHRSTTKFSDFRWRVPSLWVQIAEPPIFGGNLSGEEEQQTHEPKRESLLPSRTHKRIFTQPTHAHTILLTGFRRTSNPYPSTHGRILSARRQKKRRSSVCSPYVLADNEAVHGILHQTRSMAEGGRLWDGKWLSSVV